MLQSEDLLAAGLTELARDDNRLQPPEETTEAPVDPQLPLLPTPLMEWPQFERLLLRVAKEVEGLRSVSLVGNPGQAQEGLDVIGLDEAGVAKGLQSKKYKQFSRADLDAAVKTFDDGSLPFPVPKLVIGMACSGHERKVVLRHVEINRDRDDLEVEIWDQEWLSAELRKRPDIVREFFGEATAVSFCAPHVVAPIVVPGPDAVTLANAVLAGPAAATGARQKLEIADRVERDDPEGALKLVREAQAAIEEAGFPSHAQALDERSLRLFKSLARRTDAARLLLDRLWTHLANDSPHEASQQVSALEELSEPTDDSELDALVAAAARIGRSALGVYTHPLGAIDAAIFSQTEPGLPADTARLILLHGEAALANGDVTSLPPDPFTAAANDPSLQDAELAVRLRLVAADASGSWLDLLHEARTRVHGRDLSALILARYARRRALEGDFGEADTNWGEAIEQACLVGRHEDAAAWLYSRRTLATRYRVMPEDVFHPVASALNRRPDKPRLLSPGGRIRERALDALHHKRPRVAVARLRRHLADVTVSGSWQEEDEARLLLADCYAQNGEPALAAEQLALAGQKKRLVELAKEVGDVLLPVQDHLSSPTYWVVASAMGALAAQADLIHDTDVPTLIDLALTVLNDAAAGTLVDTPLFEPSKYLAAHGLLAALMNRATGDQAVRYLELVKDKASREASHYFFTDDDHTKALVEIGHTHPALLSDVVDQLLEMFVGRSPSAERYGSDFLLECLDKFDVRARLERLADEGHQAATSLLAIATKPEGATSADLEAAQDAAERLTATPQSRSGFYARGTGAVRESLLARFLPADRRAALISKQLDRARLPHESSGNRIEYLLAAANLTDGLSKQHAAELFDGALREARNPAPSEADELDGRFRSPFGAFQFNDRLDSRPAAAMLAARLARTQKDQRAARDAALALVGGDDGADYRIAQALQELDIELDGALPYLATLGWGLRSVAAINWVKSATASDQVGQTLASDPDPRVRRTLARELAASQVDERTRAVRDRLLNDARFSVRTSLTATDVHEVATS